MKTLIIGTVIGLICSFGMFSMIYMNSDRGPDKPLNFSMKSEFLCSLVSLQSKQQKVVNRIAPMTVREFMGSKSVSNDDNRKFVIQSYLHSLFKNKGVVFFDRLMQEVGSDSDKFYVNGKFFLYLVERHLGVSHQVCCDKRTRSLFDSTDNYEFCK